MLEEDTAASTTVVCSLSASFQELEEWNDLTAPSEISPARPLQRTMSDWCQQWGMQGFLLHCKERAFITPFSWRSKAGDTHQPALKAALPLTSGLLMTCTSQQVTEPRQPHSPLHRERPSCLTSQSEQPSLIPFWGFFVALSPPASIKCCISLGKMHFSEDSWAK